MKDSLYQVSTLQALLLGYTKKVITVEEFIKHGDIGLGTYEDTDGEMILLDGQCFQACDDGHINTVSKDYGIPFATCKFFKGSDSLELSDINNMEQLKTALNIRIDEKFSLNSMHVIRIDGTFCKIYARSEDKYKASHVELKEILKHTQKDFMFEDIEGTLVGLYYPNYMNGINAAGWHLHFISKDKTLGGHVFDLSIKKCRVLLDRVTNLELEIPDSPAFDTYDFNVDSRDDIKNVEMKNKP